MYSDMALTLAGQLFRKTTDKPAANIGMDIRQLQIIKPLIARSRDSKEPQIVRITATAERPIKAANVNFTSLAADGKTWEVHASCTIQYGNTETWLCDWARIAYLIRSRVNLLVQGLDSGATKKVGHKQTYELFSTLVRYNKKYHGMKDVLIDSKNFEAASLIEFVAKEDDGDFEYNPYWIDNITHLSGYVLNGSDAVDHNKTVYISHGWESCRVARPISGDRTYRNYVKMQPGPGNTMAGDVYVFDDNEIVAVIGGVKFQAIPRTLLNKLLPPTNGFIPSSAPRKESRKPEAKPQKILQAIQKSVPLKSRPVGQSKASLAINTFMSIIADELGMETSELLNKSVFTDIGVDSLMSLAITGRIREELDLDVPTSLFTDNATIGEAKAALLALRDDEAADDDASGNNPRDNDEDSDVSDGKVTEEPNGSETLSGGNIASDAVIDKILEIISDELGTEPSELDDVAQFSDMGVDSLMSLSITGRIREELDMDIPSSFFTDNPTINDAKAAIVALSDDSVISTPTADSSGDSLLDDNTSISINSEGGESGTKPAARSILLKGNPKTALKTLFLFPDGSGSASSYSSFPSVSPSVCIYGLNCPFIKSPADYTNGIKGVALQYLSEVQRRQSTGPYSLGGWSAGGIIAYQVACELQNRGELIEDLVLIDAPCPINIEPLPSELLHFIESKGLLVSKSNSKKPPWWLVPHFEATIRNLAGYKPVPMDPRKAPKTLIVWAREGLYQNPDDDGRRFPRSEDERSSIAFLLDDREDFGSNGWGELLGEENITCVSTKGNHFTIIREPAVNLHFTSKYWKCLLT